MITTTVHRNPLADKKGRDPYKMFIYNEGTDRLIFHGLGERDGRPVIVWPVHGTTLYQEIDMSEYLVDD